MLNPLFGQAWLLTSAPTNAYWQVIAPSANGSKLLAVSQHAIYTSTNSGATWMQNTVPLSGDVLQSGASSADGTILVAGDYEYIYISTNSGNTWFRSSDAPVDYWYSIVCSADGTELLAAPYYAAGNPQPLYISHDSGITWMPTSTPSNHWTAVASSADGTRLIALPNYGPVYISTNSGATWTSNNMVAYWRSVASSADGIKVVAVSNPGQLYTSTNGGVTWNSHFISGSGTGFSSVASSADGTRLVAVSAGIQSIFVSTNSGNTWEKQTNAPLSADWNVVASSADGHKLFAATYRLVVNDNSGGIYSPQTAPSPQMNLALVSTNLAISWTVPSTNFVLQQDMHLTTTNWLTVTNSLLFFYKNIRYQVILLPKNDSMFYRLASP